MGLGLAMLGGAGIGALGSYLGGRESRKASDRATDEQRRQFELMREDQAPWREAGLTGLNRLQELLNDPNYIRNISRQGVNALDNSAASRGLYGSTGHKKRIADYVGNNAQGQYMNRLAALAGVGQSATNTTNTLGQGYANNISQGIQNAGNARASTYMGIGNSLSNGVDQFMRYQGMQNGLSGLTPQSYAPPQGMWNRLGY